MRAGSGALKHYVEKVRGADCSVKKVTTFVSIGEVGAGWPSGGRRADHPGQRLFDDRADQVDGEQFVIPLPRLAQFHVAGAA